jgi:SAM-dependent methyltransferase
MMNPAEFAHIAEAEERFWWYEGMREIMFGLLDPYAKSRQFERVLEAGCGTGHFARVLARRYGWKIFPVDLAREGLAYARGAGQTRLAQANVAALPYRDGSFDLVSCMDVVVHFPEGEEDRPLRELARVLKTAGILVLRVSALPGLRSRHSEYVLERQRFTRRRLIRAIEQAGVRVLRCSYANSLLAPIAFVKFRLWEPLTRQPPGSGVAPGPEWQNKLLALPLRLEARWLGAGLNFPLGQSLILIGEKA